MKIYISPERREKPHGKFYSYGIYETEYCYEVANYVANILNYVGFDVKLPSRNIDMYQRVYYANEWDANYYLCIHTNASTNDISQQGKNRGIWIIRYGDKGNISDKACEITLNELKPLYNGDKTKCNVVANTGNFYEINKTKMVSVYCEIAFHDNLYDADWLLHNTRNIAMAIAQGVLKYFGLNKYFDVLDKTTTDIFFNKQFNFYDLDTHSTDIKELRSLIVECYNKLNDVTTKLHEISDRMENYEL